MRLIILHYHILKNAGSTIEDFLDHSFGERFVRLDKPGNRNGVIETDAILEFCQSTPQTVAVSSHHIRYPLPFDPNILFFDICLLRDPIDRVRSMYDYFRGRPDAGDPVSNLANGSTLGDFVRGLVQDFPLQVRNVQVNLIAAAGDSDEPERSHLELATSRIARSSFPGVVDMFEESVSAGQYYLQAAFPELQCTLPPANVSRGMEGTVKARREKLRSVCEPQVWDELLHLTALDSQLVESARNEVRRRLQLIPRGVLPRTPEAFAKKVVAARHLSAVSMFTAAKWLWQALLHVITVGAFEGFYPNPLFDTIFYLEKYDDVRCSGINPWLHYLQHGCREDRKPHRLFQPEYYLAQCPEAGRGNGNPLIHFMKNAEGQSCRPHRLFDGNAEALIESLLNEPRTECPADHRQVKLRIDDVQATAFITPANEILVRAEQRRFLRSVNFDQLLARL